MRREPRRPVPRLALSKAEAAASIGVSPSSFQLMVDEGRMPRPRNWHSRKLFLVSEIEVALYDLPADDYDYNAPVIEPAYPAKEKATDQKNADADQEPTWETARNWTPEQWKEYEKQRHEEWVAKVPGSPFHKVEMTALKQLFLTQAQHPIDVRKIKCLGWSTQERLELRGFIQLSQIEGKPDWRRNVILTAAGVLAAKKLSEDGSR